MREDLQRFFGMIFEGERKTCKVLDGFWSGFGMIFEGQFFFPMLSILLGLCRAFRRFSNTA